MSDLICDYCGRDIRDDVEYIETKYGEIYCMEDELLEVLELQEYFTWKTAEEK